MTAFTRKALIFLVEFSFSFISVSFTATCDSDANPFCMSTEMDPDSVLISGLLTNLTGYNYKMASKPDDEQLKLRHKRGASPWGFTKKEIRELFDDYYKCIKERENSHQSDNGINAILALEGQSVTMDCGICVRPDQDMDHYNIEWQRLTVEDGVLTYVKENERIKINKKRSLIFKWVDVVDAGQYFCVRTTDQEYETIYQLDVLFRERRKTISEKDSPKQLLKDFQLPENNLKTFTLWSSWSNCNQCGKIGQRRKVGLCMVKKINANKAISPVDIPIIKLYLNGIPCRSTALPKEIAAIRRIKYRRSETIMGSCKIPCPTVPAQVYVTDSSGKVIEVVKPGYYSLKDKPRLPPMVIRRVFYKETKTHLVLKCPSKSDNKGLVRWQRGEYIINPLTIKRQTRGRVFIDTINRLHVRRLRLHDSAPYNCWVQKTHIATLKVIVVEAMNNDLKNYITYTGLGVTIFSVSLICFCVICKTGKKKLTR